MIPDARCPRCKEIRPRDGSVGHTTSRNEYCTVMNGKHVYVGGVKRKTYIGGEGPL